MLAKSVRRFAEKAQIAAATLSLHREGRQFEPVIAHQFSLDKAVRGTGLRENSQATAQGRDTKSSGRQSQPKNSRSQRKIKMLRIKVVVNSFTTVEQSK